MRYLLCVILATLITSSKGQNAQSHTLTKTTSLEQTSNKLVAAGSINALSSIDTIDASLAPQTFNLDINLNNIANGLDSLYGISFIVDLDTAVIDMSNIVFDYSNSIFGTPNVDFLFIEYIGPDYISCGLTRFNNPSIVGNGHLCQISLSTITGISANQALFDISVESANDPSGNPLAVDPSNLTIPIINLFPPCVKPDFVSLGTERTTALCPDDSVKIFVVNPQGPGLTYQWYKSDAIIPGAVDSFYYAKEVRKYKVRVTSGPGCFRNSGRIQPTVAIPPPVTITPQGPTDICAGDSVLLVANYVPGYSYQWRRFGVDIPGATDTLFYASQPGNYKIFITNDGGCISKSSNVSVNIVCRLAGSNVANDIEVMPNPTSDYFSVKLNDLGNEVPVSVELIDQQGRLIESKRVNGQSLLEYSASQLSNGNYTVIIRFESGETVEKVVSVVR